MSNDDGDKAQLMDLVPMPVAVDNPDGLQPAVYHRIRWLVGRGYDKDDEILDHFEREWHKGRGLSLRERRAIGRFIPLVRAALAGPTPGPNPADLVTWQAIADKRAELEAAGLPSGDRSLAKALGVHRSTVRRRQGKVG